MKRTILAVAALGLLLWLAVPVRARQMPNTGGITIFKTDVAGDPLPGAAYRILRQATRRELQDSGVKKELLAVDGEHLTVVELLFWDNMDCTGEKISRITTGETGKARLFGLPEGECYLEEVTAPEGYQRMTAPIKLRIHRYSHATEEDGIYDDAGKLIDNTVHIITIRYRLPDTGSNTGALLISGSVAAVSGLGLVVLLRRKEQ